MPELTPPQFPEKEEEKLIKGIYSGTYSPYVLPHGVYEFNYLVLINEHISY